MSTAEMQAEWVPGDPLYNYRRRESVGTPRPIIQLLNDTGGDAARWPTPFPGDDLDNPDPLGHFDERGWGLT